jgi:hypothetical protein
MTATVDLGDEEWRMYDRPATEQELAAAKAEAFRLFRQRFGVAPAHILVDRAYIYAGPNPVQQARSVELGV